MKHELIRLPDYLVVIDPEAPVQKGEICLFRAEVDYLVRATDPIEEGLTIQDIHWKILAHLPIGDEPALEGITLLPQLERKGLPSLFECEMETPAESFSSFIGNFLGSGTLPKWQLDQGGRRQWLGKYHYPDGTI